MNEHAEPVSRRYPRGIAFCLILLLFALALPAQASIISSEQDAGTKDGSRLRNDDRILIWPKAILSPNGAKDANPTHFFNECVSLYNRARVDYFVPWHSDGEWQSFLTARAGGQLNTPQGTVDAGHCCSPQVVQICNTSIPSTPGLPPEQDTNLGQRIVAARNVPGNPMDLEHYGAVLDVKSMQSSIILNNNLINYEVTYMCGQDGNWTKTREIGSCVPVDGACNGALTASPLTTFPASTSWDTTLCAPGSIPHDSGGGVIVSGTGPWDWQCDGTPGRASAQCHATYNGCSTGLPQNGLRQLPNDLSTLCQPGNTPINIAPLVGNGPWDWQCKKNDNGFLSTCHAAYDPSSDGTCNPAYTQNLQSVVPLPKTNLCLGSDGMTPIDAIADATCNNTRCNWTCAGTSGGSNTACHANRQQTPGQCGLLSGVVAITQPPANDPGLCAQGSPTTPSLSADSTTWQWGCVGSPNPVTQNCSAPNLNAPVIGACGAGSGKFYNGVLPPVLTPGQYCASGVPTPVLQTPIGGTGSFWTWICKGSNGGADSASCWLVHDINYAGAGCGTANNGTFNSQPPAPSLCMSGNTPSPVTATGTGWSWSCDDTLYPGSPVYCSATNAVQPIAGRCGAAQGQLFGNIALPPNASQLCDNGGTVLSLNWPTDPYSNATVTWGCAGQNGGANTAVNACWGTYVPPVDGQCGVATTWTPNNISIIQNAPANQLCQPAGLSLPSNYAANYDPNHPELATITWTCSKASATGQPKSCAARYIPSPQNGQCGTIPDNSISSRPPDSVLCQIGSSYDWSAPVAGSGPGTVRWSCTGMYGGQPANCQQTGIEVVDPNGQCGKANGAYVPDTPNYNLCANGGGAASAVTGTGPWSWTCGSAHVPCQAYPCTVCAGNLNHGFTNVVVGSPTTKPMGQCNVMGQPIWSANAQLQISNNVPVTLSWTDSFNGNVSQSITPAAAPVQYCAPCYMKPTALIGAETGALVKKISGNSCPPGVTENPSIMPGTNMAP